MFNWHPPSVSPSPCLTPHPSVPGSCSVCLVCGLSALSLCVCVPPLHPTPSPSSLCFSLTVSALLRCPAGVHQQQGPRPSEVRGPEGAFVPGARRPRWSQRCQPRGAKGWCQEGGEGMRRRSLWAPHFDTDQSVPRGESRPGLWRPQETAALPQGRARGGGEGGRREAVAPGEKSQDLVR